MATTGASVVLDDDPFTWQVTKDGRVLVFRSGRRVAVMAGAAADRLRPRFATTLEDAQQALAAGNRQLPTRQREREPTPLPVRGRGGVAPDPTRSCGR
jgi:hypothetical protein